MSHDFSFVNCKNLPEIDVNDPEFVNTVIILLKLKKIVKKFGGLIVLKKAINLATPGKQITNHQNFKAGMYNFRLARFRFPSRTNFRW